MAKRGTGGRGGDAVIEGDNNIAVGGDGGDAVIGDGGSGGDAHVVGNNSMATGGQGGRGGLGLGGPGGDAIVYGDDIFAVGGQGGEASQVDGRGGRGGRSYWPPVLGARHHRHMKRPYGEPNDEPGRGGDAPDTPQYQARRLVIEDLKASYFRDRSLPLDDVWYDRDIVPVNWINEQLIAEGYRWRVSIVADEYEFSDVS